MPDFELLTTSECTKLLNCKANDVIHFLKGAGVKYIRFGQGYLWHKEETLSTIQTIRDKRKEVELISSLVMKNK